MVDMIALHHQIQREQYFDVSRSQIGLNLLTTASGYMIASYQMAARPHLQHLLISTARQLIDECADFDSYGIDLSNCVIFDDPVLFLPSCHRAISRANKSITRILKSQSLDPDIPNPLLAD